MINVIKNVGDFFNGWLNLLFFIVWVLLLIYLVTKVGFGIF